MFPNQTGIEPIITGETGETDAISTVYLCNNVREVYKCLAASSAQFSRFFSKSLCGKAAALQIFDAGLKRADPYTAVYNYLKESKDAVDGVPVG